MARKWNRIVAQEDYGVGEVIGGTLRRGLNVAMCDDDVEATRQGYKCIQCFENFESAWPVLCPVCSFPVREHQAELFGKIYDAHAPIARTGPDWDALAEQLEERQERRRTLARAKESRIVLGTKRIGESLSRMKGR